MIILYFNKEVDLMSAITKSMRNNEIGKELQLKKQDDYIDEYGNLKDKIRRTHDKNFTSRTSGCSMEWRQSEPIIKFNIIETTQTKGGSEG